jgi:hypothetical protein
MQYRSFGGIDFRPSVLGFGAMRLPQLTDGTAAADDAYGRIDVASANAMLRRAVEAGVNYIDTAYPYHDGASERWLGQALPVVARDLFGPGETGFAELRGRLKVATKLPMFRVQSHDDCERYFSEQLERLQLDSVDFYLLHGLRAGSVAKMREYDVLAWAEEALAAGRIGHLGFSFHDQYPVFEEVLDATDIWEFCQIQYNFMDEEFQAGTRGLENAAARGLGVIVMEPLRGGRLSRRPPEAVAELWAAANARREAAGATPRSPVDWALRWVWDHAEVSFLLSGMSSMDQLEENLACAEQAAVGVLSADELDVYRQVRDAYLDCSPIDCTNCRYCLPCPSGVAIPEVLGLYNEAIIYNGGPAAARFAYGWLPEPQRAEACTQCHDCEELCPQQIAIPDWLEKIRQFLALGE